MLKLAKIQQHDNRRIILTFTDGQTCVMEITDIRAFISVASEASKQSCGGGCGPTGWKPTRPEDLKV